MGGAWEAPARICKDGETGLRGAQAPGSGDLDIGAWALCMCFPWWLTQGGTPFANSALPIWAQVVPAPPAAILLAAPPLWGSYRNLRFFLPLTTTCKLSADPVAAAFIDCPEFPLLTPILTNSEGVPVNTHEVMLLFCSQTLHGSHFTQSPSCVPQGPA